MIHYVAFGIYLLANDAVIDWFEACANSLSRWAPEVPVCVIPFASDLRRVGESAVRRQYRVLPEDSMLDDLEAIGSAIYDRGSIVARLFRKLRVFGGPFDRFLYLDVDVVLTRPLSDWIGPLLASDSDLVFTDAGAHAAFRGRLYRELVERGGRPEFSTGSFTGRRRGDIVEFAQNLISEARRYRDDFVPMGEQPFVNYLWHRSGLSALSALDVVDGFPLTTWAGSDTVCFTASSALAPSGEPMPFVHWAGMSFGPSVPGWRLLSRTRAPLMRHRIALEARVRTRSIIRGVRQRLPK